MTDKNRRAKKETDLYILHLKATAEKTSLAIVC